MARDSMISLSPDQRRDTRDRNRTAGHAICLLAFLSLFSIQGYMMARLVPPYLASLSAMPAVYAHVESIYDAILDIWGVMLLLAVFNPILQLLGIYIRRKRHLNLSEKTGTMARTVYLLAYLLLLISIYIYQNRFITRSIATNLAACCSAPELYTPIRNIIDTVLHVWQMLFVGALTYAITETVIGPLVVRLKARVKSSVPD